MKTLDITEFKQDTAIELHTAIENAVGETQRVVIQELPYELLMTSAQFEILKPSLDETFIPDFFTYKTKHNVMEVKVSDIDASALDEIGFIS